MADAPRPPVRTVRALIVAGRPEVEPACRLLADGLTRAGVDVNRLSYRDYLTAGERILRFLGSGRREDELLMLYLGGETVLGAAGLYFSLVPTVPRGPAEIGVDLAGLASLMNGPGRYAVLLDARSPKQAVDRLRGPRLAVLAYRRQATRATSGEFLATRLSRGLDAGDLGWGDGRIDLLEVRRYLGGGEETPGEVALRADGDPSDYVIGWLEPRPRPTFQPNPLPRPATVFVGRERELARITEMLTDRRDRPPLVAITGPGGIGKTQLAIHVVSAVQDRYGGIAYLSAKDGFDTAMVRFAATAGLMSSRGHFQDAMESLHLVDRPTLFIVDDVDPDDPNLRPAELRVELPPECAMVLVGPKAPPGMARHAVTLEGLRPAEVIELLARLGAGGEGVHSRLLARVQGSPLFARLLAGSLAEGELGEGASSLRVVVERSYRRLEAGAAALFRRASLVPAALVADGMDVELAEVLVGDGGAENFEALRDAGLFTELVGGRMDFTHPQVREYAAERFEEDEDAGEREPVRRRVRGWLLGHTHHQPEPRIARDYWTVDDQLDYAPYADAIAAFIRHRDTAPPLTIGIKAQWGEGKTSLMRMVQQRLDPPDPEGRPARIHLTERSRTRLRGRRRRRRSEPEPERRVSTREVLDRAAGPPEPVEDLEAAPADQIAPGDEWRATVWFNPWMYQSSEQVWAGMAYEIIRQVTERLSIGDRERFWLELNLSRLDTEAVRRRAYRILWSRVLPLLLTAGLTAVLALLVLLVGGGAAWARYLARGGIVGAAGVAVVGCLVQRARFHGQAAAGPFAKLVSDPDRLMPDPGYADRLGFLHLVHDDIRKVLRLVATEDRPLVVFVDDLDRCSPGTVAQVIEAINLFLAGEFPNCVFVLAMEPALVAAHVEVTYKELVTALREGHAPTGEWTTLGWRFLEKIVQLPLSLPKTQPAGEVTAYVRSLLDMDGRRTAVRRQHVPVRDGPPVRVSDDVEEVAVPPPAAAPLPAPAVDLALVRRIAETLAAREPTVTTLPDLARQVQAELRPDAGEDPLLPETVRAVERVFGDLYSDADAADAMEAALPALASANPREIKRYINLFRFYTFIVQRQRLQGIPAPSGDSIAKLAALAIRWPHLLPVLSRDGSVICGLEEAARDDDTWKAATNTAGLLPRHGTDELRTFLSHRPEIGRIAARLL
ncbi:MAG: P-loop NTPase fold protein [Mycobacteriales bacterium]